MKMSKKKHAEGRRDLLHRVGDMAQHISRCRGTAMGEAGNLDTNGDNSIPRPFFLSYLFVISVY